MNMGIHTYLLKGKGAHDSLRFISAVTYSELIYSDFFGELCVLVSKQPSAHIVFLFCIP